MAETLSSTPQARQKGAPVAFSPSAYLHHLTPFPSGAARTAACVPPNAHDRLRMIDSARAALHPP
eukprot:CAMPEP_0182913352 /NCGR_PEP_ID=MMETSP0034_2-20130328/37998_1 /TAXON_ID=156128 /ORGANISM="Nephroselmis pyriformis, Strain CCMP717" /LENGTH=64 /DNA_ID=CAMNT_0025050069 /DNA_START=87 /DNA_END=278 /DNA_ORIENTATION=-